MKKDLTLEILVHGDFDTLGVLLSCYGSLAPIKIHSSMLFIVKSFLLIEPKILET